MEEDEEGGDAWSRDEGLGVEGEGGPEAACGVWRGDLGEAEGSAGARLMSTKLTVIGGRPLLDAVGGAMGPGLGLDLGSVGGSKSLLQQHGLTVSM